MSNATRGTDTMNAMLLSQYISSTNVKEYLRAYVAEMDWLFESIYDVYQGRFLETAIGAQLDVIGVILQQSRSISIPNDYFGFDGAVGANSFGTVTDSTIGGVFKSIYNLGYTVAPLDDVAYRKLLKARAWAINEKVFNEDVVYKIVSEVLDDDAIVMSITNVGYEVSLELDGAINTQTIDLLRVVSSWYIPLGFKLTITVV